MKPRVLVLVHKIQLYRIPIYNIIAKNFNLTVATEKQSIYQWEVPQFSIIIIPILRIGPFLIHKLNIFKLVKKYDVVISLQNLRCIDLMLLSLFSWRKFRLIYWGIGVSSSYSKTFDTNKKLNIFRYFLSRKADATIFYSSYPIQRYIQNGVARAKIFVANNTVKISEITSNELIRKNSILFIGTLYKEKGVLELLVAYKISYQNIGESLLKLIIIGDGPEMNNLKYFINENGLKNKVILAGAIYDQDIIKNYYFSSIACISPNQAGLSVLSSMGYKVPFITKEGAITGGELLNIKSGINGVIYKSSDELPGILEDVSLNCKKYLKMGLNAAKYYHENRKPEMMANGIIDAINYSLKK